jgi:dolichyl-phosphate-mannose-protein mannosyltransferase
MTAKPSSFFKLSPDFHEIEILSSNNRSSHPNESSSLDPPIQKTPRCDVFHLHLFFFDPNGPPVQISIIDWFFVFLIISVSFFVHRLGVGFPPSVVFDEVFFGNFTQYYHHKLYFFDIHPPLGKQLLYFGSRLTGYSYQEVFDRIGSPLNSTQIPRLRIWPCTVGVLRAPFIFTALKLIGISSWWSLTAGIFVATDQALVVQSRFALIDTFLTTFTSFTILLTSMIVRRINNRLLLGILIIAVGISAGATVSVKFTGGGVALTVIVALFMHYPLLTAIKLSIVAGVCGMSVLIVSFLIHFSMFKYPGPGCIFHESFWCSDFFEGRMNVLSATKTLISTMFSSNFGIGQTHSYSSSWWSWPLMLGRGTFLWMEGERYLWTIGSPIVWWGSTIGIVCWLIVVMKERYIRGTTWIFIGWAVSYFPFALIKRPLWNYHYFIPLLYSIVAGAIAANSIAPMSKVFPILFIVCAICCWIVYVPITYATPISWEWRKKWMLYWWIS